MWFTKLRFSTYFQGLSYFFGDAPGSHGFMLIARFQRGDGGEGKGGEAKKQQELQQCWWDDDKGFLVPFAWNGPLTP